MPGHTPPPDDRPALDRLREIVHQLRSPGGCPWDIEQTHESLVPNLLEEAYETAEAIRSGDRAHLREELGDLLLQVVMHAEIASEAGAEGGFDLDGVADAVARKLVHRHPHVYGDSDADSPEAVLKQWDAIKRDERGQHRAPHLTGIPAGLPALLRATKIQKKAAKVGFDWPDLEGPMGKIQEELDEANAAANDPSALAEELGDLLFATVNAARKAGLDAESLLTAANEKFIARFGAMEAQLRAGGQTLDEADLEAMDHAWEAAKADSAVTR